MQTYKVFKPIKGFEGYEISNFGRVKSLARTWITGRGTERTKQETFLAGNISGGGYKYVILHKNGVKKNIRVSVLVWEHYGDRKRNGQILQIHHLDHDKLNNRIDNLGLVTQRENNTMAKERQQHSSKFTGVSLDRESRKWRACIGINGKQIHLGRFDNEYEAHLAYQAALKDLD